MSATVLTFSMASSATSMPNSVSTSMTSIMTDALSALRSSLSRASGLTSSSETPSCSATIVLSLSMTIGLSSFIHRFGGCLYAKGGFPSCCPLQAFSSSGAPVLSRATSSRMTSTTPPSTTCFA